MRFKTSFVSFLAIVFCVLAVGCNASQNAVSNYSDTSGAAEIVQNNSSTQQNSTEFPGQIFSSSQSTVNSNAGSEDVITTLNPNDISYIDNNSSIAVESTNKIENSQSTVTESSSNIESSATESEEENTVSKEDNQEVSEDSTGSEVENPVNQDGEIELPIDVWG